MKNLYSLIIFQKLFQNIELREAPWPSGRASDSGARGLEFDPHSGHRVVSLSKDTFTSPKNTGNTQEAVALKNC